MLNTIDLPQALALTDRALNSIQISGLLVLVFGAIGCAVWLLIKAADDDDYYHHYKQHRPR